MSTGLKPVWAGRHMRLDPFRMPQMVSYAGREDSGDIVVTLNRQGAVIHRILAHSGLPVTVVVPGKLFRGVAARAIEDEAGQVTVTLELLHTDPLLSVPLLVADDLDDVAADWRAWAEAYCLPMLLIEADGEAHALEETVGGMLRVAKVQERRQGQAVRQRRPRFLARRRQGTLGVRLVVQGQEIIARG